MKTPPQPHPRTHVHVPPEFKQHAPDVSGYLPHSRMVDHLSALEFWPIGIIMISAVAIQIWQMTQ